MGRRAGAVAFLTFKDTAASTEDPQPAADSLQHSHHKNPQNKNSPGNCAREGTAVELPFRM